MALETAPEIYTGRFGTYSITPEDRRGVFVYRAALLVVALSFGTGALIALLQGDPWFITAAYALFCLALGVALATIHIYMLTLHRALWVFWGIGVSASLALSFAGTPLAVRAYTEPIGLIGTGFVFAALTGLCIKESFCFGWWETALVVFALPILLLGHLFGLLNTGIEQVLLGVSAIALIVFAARKCFYPVPGDIGDKTVHAYVRGELHE